MVDDRYISWQFIIAMASITLTFVGGAIWLGSLSNQISVNSARLVRLEIFEQEGRSAEANASARLPLIEGRLNNLENWQHKMNSQVK